MPKRNSELIVNRGRIVADTARPQIGEWEEGGGAPAETRFHFRTGITSVVPWLVVSESGCETRA